MSRSVLLLAICLTLTGGIAQAAIPGQDPDWPCQQRLVPDVTAGTYWNGALPDKDNWRDNPKVAALVGDIASRDVSVEDATAKIVGFSAKLSKKERDALLPEAFLGVVDETNRQREGIIERIKDLTRRQRELAEIVAKTSAEVDAIPDTATGDAATQRAEAAQRLEFVTRTFQDTQRTMRYACDVPGQLDSRLGALARSIQSHL
jgi:hypothetical protein